MGLVRLELPFEGLECNSCPHEGVLITEGDFCNLFRQPKAEFARCVKCVVNELRDLSYQPVLCSHHEPLF